MLEKEIQELEEILVPYALKRLGKLLVGKKFKNFFEWIVRAFVRCLFNITDEIHLLEITTVAIAEAYYMDEIKIFNVYDNVIRVCIYWNSNGSWGDSSLVYLFTRKRKTSRNIQSFYW